MCLGKEGFETGSLPAYLVCCPSMFDFTTSLAFIHRM